MSSRGSTFVSLDREVTPSREDIALTTRLRSAGDSLGVHLADHIIVGGDHWHSFRAAEGWDRA